jgi:hypothetical protein
MRTEVQDQIDWVAAWIWHFTEWCCDEGYWVPKSQIDRLSALYQ